MEIKIQDLTTKLFRFGPLLLFAIAISGHGLVAEAQVSPPLSPPNPPVKTTASTPDEQQSAANSADTPRSEGQLHGNFFGGDDPEAAGQVPLDQANSNRPWRPGQIIWQGDIVAPDGSVIRQIKTLSKTLRIETTYITSDDEEWTATQFRDYLATIAPDKVHRDLRLALAAMKGPELVTVVVTLKAQPGRELFQDLKVALNRQMSDMAQEFKQAKGDDRLAIQNRYDELTRTVHREAKSTLALAQQKNAAGLARWVKQVGGQMGRPTFAHSMISVKLPANRVEQLANRAEVQSVDLNHEAEASLDVSVPSVKANAFWSRGYDGSVSAFEPGVLDSGLDTAHPALSGLNVLYNIDHYWASRSSTYSDSWSNPNDYHGHGTAVTGIIASRGSLSWENWKGMAPGLARLYNLKSAYRKTNGNAGLFFSDAIDNIDWGIFDSSVDDIDLLNFSYGITTSSDDNSMARFMDAVVDDLDIPVVVAAGNGGPNSYSIVNPANAYNILSVASMNDINTTYRSDDVIAYSSSRGPTIGGRKKPDITAPGAFIKTLNKDWESEFDFNTWSGTSFAAPHVTGAVLLLMDYFGPPVEPKRIKAVLLNSCGKWGSVNWNSTYGWGYLNLENAWETRNDSFVRHVSPEGSSDDFDLYLADFRPTRDMATLVWNRHVDYAANGNYPNTWYGLNDLDLNLYKHDDGQLLDVSASGKDNVEQVWYQPAETTQCVIRVEAEDLSFSAVAQEQYALAGPPGLMFPADLPQIDVTIVAPATIQRGRKYKILIKMENMGDINAIDPSALLSLPPGHTLVENSNPQATKTLVNNQGNVAEAIWVVRAPKTTGTGTISVDVSSYCWGQTWNGSDSFDITVTN